MRIAILCEGKTEMAFMPFLRQFLSSRLNEKMPKLDPVPYDGRIPTGEKLRRIVKRLIADKRPADAVIALTDVYTGSNPPEFPDASSAKSKMLGWVGSDDRFHPHVALHDFEAWLLPYWEKIKKLAGSNRAPPACNPEEVNHMKPPARWLAEVFRTGTRGQGYVKVRDAARILKGEDLLVAALACPELKSFLNTILGLCDKRQVIP